MASAKRHGSIDVLGLEGEIGSAAKAVVNKYKNLTDASPRSSMARASIIIGTSLGKQSLLGYAQHLTQFSSQSVDNESAV